MQHGEPLLCGGALGALPTNPVPTDDAERVAALRGLGWLDSPPTESFDRVTRLAAAALRVPTMLVSLVDTNRQWFKSRVGLEVAETPRHVSFCTHAVYERRPLVVPDALQDARFAANPLVTGAPFIRAYLGVPLYTRDRLPVGTLCAIDRQPRDFSETEVAMLADFAKIIEEFLHSRDSGSKADAEVNHAVEREHLFRETFEQAAIGILHVAPDGRLLRINQRTLALLGYTQAELHGTAFRSLAHPEDLAKSVAEFERARAGEIRSYRLEQRLLKKDRTSLWSLVSVSFNRADAGGPAAGADYAIVAIEDISALKRAEAGLRHARDSLQTQVALQTQKLRESNAALRASMTRRAAESAATP